MSTALLLPLLVACDKVKEAIRGEPDLRWQGDSAMLATKPGIVFRLVPSGDTAVQIVPIATMGAQGAREIHFTRRGWRAFDLEYLQSAAPITVTRSGRATNDLRSHRGFWEPSSMDTMLERACPATVIPFGLGRVNGPQAWLATNHTPVPLKYPGELSAAELQSAMETVPLLIAPTAGISTSALQRYERRIYQVPSASGPSPTIIVVYDDPEVPADSLVPMTERPRHFLVVLDKGIYGYKPSWTHKALGNAKDPMRLRFLDALDVNGDGLVELFFGIRDVPQARYTRILRFETDAWREAMVYWGRSPCDR